MFILNILKFMEKICTRSSFAPLPLMSFCKLQATFVKPLNTLA